MSNENLSQSLTGSTECDREPIHQIASIQTYGCLIAFSWPDRRIQVASENAEIFFARPKSEILGSKLDYIFEGKFLDTISDQVRIFPWISKGVHLNVRAQINGAQLDVFLFETEGLFVLEFEKFEEVLDSGEERERTVKDFLVQAKSIPDLGHLSRVTCQTIRSLTGLDRVMVYRFIAPHWHGEVIAEDRVTSVHSYLGHRFPASDIPAQARNLYLRNSVRLIADSSQPSVKISPELNPKTHRPLDLSDSRLRASSPIHLEYLKNMGVVSSFSVAIGTAENLWGLITCHHLTPISISQSTRTACEIVANTFAIQAPLFQDLQVKNRVIKFDLDLRKLLAVLRLSRGNLSPIFTNHIFFGETFRAAGIALVGEHLLDLAGMTPRKADIEKIAAWVRGELKASGKDWFQTDELSKIIPDFSDLIGVASGVLAMVIPSRPDEILLLFRPELKQTLTWGGDPRKQLDRRSFAGQINPRVSFHAWDEVIQARSEEWRDYEIDGLKFLCQFM